MCDYVTMYLELTAQHHDKDAKHFLIVGVGSYIAKSDWDETGKREVESCAVASLIKTVAEQNFSSVKVF